MTGKAGPSAGPPEVAIRLAGMAEAAEIAALHGRCLAPAWSEAMVAPYLENGAGFVLLAVPRQDAGASDALGFFICRVVGGEAELLAMGLVPEARGRGLGAALLAAGRSAAARRGARRMFLEVAEDNAAAQRLYEQQGFRPVGRREAYYRTAKGPVGALVLQCDL